MNSFKLNSFANFYLRKAICKFFNIPIEEVYRKVKNIEETIITTSDGKKYELTLKEIT